MFSSCLSSSLLLQGLRKQKEIVFQPQLSSSMEFNVNEGSPFRLTCAFLSNFDIIDILWFHNDTLIQSFISKVRRKMFEYKDLVNICLSLFEKKKMMK